MQITLVEIIQLSIKEMYLKSNNVMCM